MALLGAGGATTSWAELATAVSVWSSRLGHYGLGRRDRIAVAVPNGVPVAETFLGVAANAICAPLNPAHTEPEAQFYLDDLDAGLVIVSGDSASGVRSAAKAAGVPVLDLAEPQNVTGLASVSANPHRTLEDVALILHTSGTTSRPKQVPLTHANLSHSAANIAATLRLEPLDRCGNLMPLFHIHGLVACLLASLHAGASVVCTGGFDPKTTLATLADRECTWYSAVPTIHHAMLDAAARRPTDAERCSLRFIRSSSAALPPVVMEGLEVEFGVPVIEAYGMTEAAHQMTSNQLPPNTRRAGTVGVAAGPEVSVVDPDGAHVNVGAVGEVVIRGPNVMAGYISPPEANNTAFTNGWFRTGDQGSIGGDGVVTITGRLKELINRGGEKIAPREIDEPLLADPEIAAALAFALPHSRLGEEVAAVVVPTDPASFDPDAVRDRARTRLAEFKVPRRLIVVDELPTGPTGKPTRIGLATKLGLEPDHDDGPATAGSASDDQPLVAAVAGVVASVLGLASVGAGQDFVGAGGDSLSALTLVAAIDDVFGVAIRAGRVLGDGSTPRKMADEIRACRSRDPQSHTDEPQIRGWGRGIWAMQLLHPESAAYNVALALRIRGRVDDQMVEHSLTQLADRHDALRTRITEHGGGALVVAARGEPVPFTRREITERDIQTFVADLTSSPIDLATEPLRVGIGELNANDRVVVLVLHHALVDGPSRQTLKADLATMLEGGELETLTNPPSIRFATAGASLDFWKAELGDAPPPPQLPVTSALQDRDAGRVRVVVRSAVVGELRVLAARRQATLFAILLAAHTGTLRRVSGEADLIVAVPVTTRHPAAGYVVGMFVETVPVRIRLDGVSSVDGLVAETKRALTSALSHSDVPFEDLVQIASTGGGSARPLASSLCQLRPPEPDHMQATAFTIEELEVAPTGARFDLALDLVTREGHLEAVLDYDPDAISASDAAKFAERFVRLLEGMAAGTDLAQIDITSTEERLRLNDAAKGREPDSVDFGDLDAVLEGLAADAPGAIAIEDGDSRTTRTQLQARARAFASAFASLGVGPDNPVGIALDRSADAIAAMIGAWRLGAAYVPLTSATPTARDHAVVRDAGVVAVVSPSEAWDVPVIALDTLDEGTDPAPCLQPVRGELAWIIATSGSTGTPKLVPGTMQGLINRLAWGRRALPVTGPSMHRSPLVFVDHVAEIFEPLVAGHVLVIADDSTATDPRRLGRLLRDRRITRMVAVPSLLRMVLRGVGGDIQLPALETVVSSGEPLPQDLARAWLERFPNVQLVNVYGSTEVAADATSSIVQLDGLVTVGKPIDGMEVRVMSSSGTPAPPGSVGEFWVTGSGVMSGYLDSASNGRLVAADPDGGGQRTWFRTGDRGRLDAKDDLIVQGRTDRQLKIRGVRIDPGEVETKLRGCAGITDAVVMQQADALVAVLVPFPDQVLEPAAIRARLAELLPATHIPSRFHVVPELPLTPTGKVDRVLVSAIEVHRLVDPLVGRAEQWLGERWMDLLDLGVLPGPHDDFFAVGGHSVIAVELFAGIYDDLGVDLSVSEILDSPTIRMLAMQIGRSPVASGELAALAEPARAKARAPIILWTAGLHGNGRARRFRSALAAHARLLVLASDQKALKGRPARSIAALVAQHRRRLASTNLDGGATVVGGNSFGGLIAAALNQSLCQSGVEVDLLVIVDTWAPGSRPERTSRLQRFPALYGAGLCWKRHKLRLNPSDRRTVLGLRRLASARRFKLAPIETPVLLFTTEQRRRGKADLGWGKHVRGPLRIVELAGAHPRILHDDRVDDVTAATVASFDEHRLVSAEGPRSAASTAATRR